MKFQALLLPRPGPENMWKRGDRNYLEKYIEPASPGASLATAQLGSQDSQIYWV